MNTAGLPWQPRYTPRPPSAGSSAYDPGSTPASRASFSAQNPRTISSRGSAGSVELQLPRRRQGSLYVPVYPVRNEWQPARRQCVFDEVVEFHAPRIAKIIRCRVSRTLHVHHSRLSAHTVAIAESGNSSQWAAWERLLDKMIVANSQNDTYISANMLRVACRTVLKVPEKDLKDSEVAVLFSLLARGGCVACAVLVRFVRRGELPEATAETRRAVRDAAQSAKLPLNSMRPYEQTTHMLERGSTELTTAGALRSYVGYRKAIGTFRYVLDMDKFAPRALTSMGGNMSVCTDSVMKVRSAVARRRVVTVEGVAERELVVGRDARRAILRLCPAQKRVVDVLLERHARHPPGPRPAPPRPAPHRPAPPLTTPPRSCTTSRSPSSGRTTTRTTTAAGGRARW